MWTYSQKQDVTFVPDQNGSQTVTIFQCFDNIQYKPDNIRNIFVNNRLKTIVLDSTLT